MQDNVCWPTQKHDYAHEIWWLTHEAGHDLDPEKHRRHHGHELGTGWALPVSVQVSAQLLTPEWMMTQAQTADRVTTQAAIADRVTTQAVTADAVTTQAVSDGAHSECCYNQSLLERKNLNILDWV